MKYAVVKIGGSQYLVSEGDELSVNKLSGAEGKKIEFPEVLLLVDDKKVQIGKPLVKGTVIKAEIIKQYQGKKVRIAKFKAKTGYRRVTGFRPQLTKIKIQKVF